MSKQIFMECRLVSCCKGKDQEIERTFFGSPFPNLTWWISKKQLQLLQKNTD